ncbi:MAG: hypothetical protein DMG42_30520, partial [Acidobacteria bacterium]
SGQKRKNTTSTYKIGAHPAGWRRWTGVLGGALVMCAGATLLAIASSTQGPAGHSLRGVWAALGAGVLWGTMYIPYRKAYLTGMNPLSFVTFFTFGEVGMMSALAVDYTGLTPLWQELLGACGVIFWLMLGGFIWVIGDLFQQYAAKYVGISRGIPLSNSNQLWGLLWGIFVFGELHGRPSCTYLQVVGGSLLMMLGVAAVAFSSASGEEQARWKEAAAPKPAATALLETTLKAAWTAAGLRMSRCIPVASGTGFSSLPPAVSLLFLPGWLASREWACMRAPLRCWL